MIGLYMKRTLGWNGLIKEIKRQKELQQQKLLLPSLMISIAFVNHLKTLACWIPKLYFSKDFGNMVSLIKIEKCKLK